jgi:hypothetical protein
MIDHQGKPPRVGVIVTSGNAQTPAVIFNSGLKERGEEDKTCFETALHIFEKLEIVRGHHRPGLPHHDKHQNTTLFIIHVPKEDLPPHLLAVLEEHERCNTLS